MYFIECARLAEQHADLALVFERLGSEFRTMRAVEVLRPDVWSSFLNIDPNQMRSALDMLAEQGVLRREEMIECRGCDMVALLSDYRAGLEEDGEYRCTDCDRPLEEGDIRTIMAYRSGEAWPEAGATTSTRATRDGERGKGFAANAEDHRKVAAAVAAIGDNWMANLPGLCRELHRIGAEVPRYWREEEVSETWDEVAEAVDGPGTSSGREKVSAYVRYRLRWIRSHPAVSQ